MMFARHCDDRADHDPLRFARNEELAESGVTSFGIYRTGSRKNDDVVSAVRPARPHLRAVKQPTPRHAGRLRLGCSKIGASSILAEANCKRQTAGRDLRKQAVPLLIAAIREQGRGDLAVGHPMSCDRSTLCQQLFGNNVSVHVGQPTSAVDGGNGQAEKSRATEP